MEYNWKRDKDSFEESPKITYIKKVEELGWYVSFGEYVESHEDDVKKEIITTKAVTIECPSIPNYIKVDGQMVHISSLSEGTLIYEPFMQFIALDEVTK